MFFPLFPSGKKQAAVEEIDADVELEGGNDALPNCVGLFIIVDIIQYY
jgi:hypothetical protein